MSGIDFGVRQCSVLSVLFTLYLYHLGKMEEVLLFYAGNILLISLSLIYLELLLYAVECELDWLDLWSTCVGGVA